MKLLAPLTTVLILSLLLPSSVEASGGPRRPSTPSTIVTFHLQVSGQAPAGTTFWVAYGPLAGHFGLIRLRSSGHGGYMAAERLPAHGRTIFAYLAGVGMIHTKLGFAPGAPVTTIRRLGPLTVENVSHLQVQWQAPIG